MREIPIDLETVKSAGLGYSDLNGVATFLIPNGARKITVTVKVSEGKWQFFPERSSGQKSVLARLGL